MSGWIVALLLGGAVAQEAAAPPAAAQAPIAARPAAAAGRIEAAVDRRVELFTLLARFAGFEEFNMAVARSPYSVAADSWFRDHKRHPALARLQALRRDHGVSYDAIASLAVHVEDSIDLEERVDFATAPERLDKRWPVEQVRPLLDEVRDFVQVADSEGFFDTQEERFTQGAARLRAVIEGCKALPWFDATFGARSGARYCAIPGFVCGGGNYGMGIRYADGRDEEILPIFGCSSFDAAGVPTFGAEMAGLVIHELCHSYTNAFVDQLGEQLRPASTRLFDHDPEAMRRQAYGSWQTVAYETLVRATVVACLRATDGEAAGAKQAKEERDRGFLWVPALAADLDRFSADRKRWPTFADFLPELVTAFEREAAALPR